jgi:SAM-dependent methyltransferase
VTDSDQAIEIYERNAAALAEQYESLGTGPDFLHLIPPAEPGAIALDIGAGSGRDAESLVELGYEVVAAEPAANMRSEGMKRHGLKSIKWLDDRLPSLEALRRAGRRFDLILVSAVWHHVLPADRPAAFRNIATLMRPGALLVMTLRHGPAPEGRPVFPADLGEVERLALDCGLEMECAVETEDELERADLGWTSVMLRNPAMESGKQAD